MRGAMRSAWPLMPRGAPGGRSVGWASAHGAWRRPSTGLRARKRPRTIPSASRMVRVHAGSNALVMPSLCKEGPKPRLMAAGRV